MASTIRNLIEITGLAENIPHNPTVFKQFTIQETLELPEAKPDMEQIVRVIAQAVINCTKVIRTPVGRSLEGQNLTGYKLVVEGEIRQKIEYAADDITQSLHAAHFTIPFSSFIVLPQNYTIGTAVFVSPYIENICVDLINKRTIYKSILILLDATL